MIEEKFPCFIPNGFWFDKKRRLFRPLPKKQEKETEKFFKYIPWEECDFSDEKKFGYGGKLVLHQINVNGNIFKFLPY